MQETKENNQPDTDLKDITLEPGIYNFTPDIKEYIGNGIPLTDEEQNVLRTFNQRYSFPEDIQRRGKETILRQLDRALECFDFEQAKQAVAEGVNKAQGINPDVKIKAFPVVFLFLPGYGDYTSLHGQGCGVNIDALRANSMTLGSPYANIVSGTTHESVHTFLRQLGVNQEQDLSPKQRILSFIWEEGLTTYMESIHYPHHNDIENDAQFWVDTVNRWFDTNDPNEKDKIFEVIKNRPSFLRFLSDMYHMSSLPSNIDASERGFRALIRDRNGIGYHIGSYIWKRQIEKAKKEGKTLKDLVMAGSGQMEQWIGENIY